MMIDFDYKLPSMNINGKQNGTYNNREMDLPCILTTETAKPGNFCEYSTMRFVGNVSLFSLMARF
jgi:hypothetical protein